MEGFDFLVFLVKWFLCLNSVGNLELGGVIIVNVKSSEEFEFEEEFGDKKEEVFCKGSEVRLFCMFVY